MNDVQSVSVFEAEEVTFTCEFSKGNTTDIDIDWTFDDNIFECGSSEDDIAPDDNGCYTKDTHSVLLLRDISSLAVGSYPVQCILQQSIPDVFRNDPSFQENFNSITRSASLTIEAKSKLFPKCMGIVLGNNQPMYL